MNELKRQTVSGIKWLVGSSFLQKAISVGTMVILARILGPADFGLFALAFIAIDALGLFKSMGFDSALIQRKDNVEKAANTAFFIIPVLGLLLYLILAISAPLIGRFLNNEQVVSIIRVLGIIFVISCFGKVPAALMEKNMQFRQVSLIEISTSIVFSASAIILALLGRGVWSLVIAYILKTVNQNVLLFIFAKWRPRLEFDKKIALEMFHFGKFIFLGSIIWFFKANLDNILVGKILGVTALGLYAIAFNIANFCADYFGSKVSRVIFPTYSKMQDDLEDMRFAVLKTLKYINIFAMPFGLGLFSLSKEFLTIIYGKGWVEASFSLMILSWAGILNSLSATFAGIFLASGRPKLGFWLGTLQVFIFFIFITPMAKLYGINGVAIVVLISSLFSFIFGLFFTIKFTGIKVIQIYLSLKTTLLASFYMAIVIFLFKLVLVNIKMGFFVYYGFILLFLFALITYIYSLYIIEKKLFKEIVALIFL